MSCSLGALYGTPLIETTWQSLMWMWNGWLSFAWLMIVHSSTVPSRGSKTGAAALASLASPIVLALAIDPSQPGTLFANRVNQMDFRLTKNFTVNKTKINAMVDVFNLLNSSDVQTLNVRVGPQWQQPTQILEGRYFKFSAQLNF